MWKSTVAAVEPIPDHDAFSDANGLAGQWGDSNLATMCRSWDALVPCTGSSLQSQWALPCRFMDMESFALEADAKAAVVLVALQGGPRPTGRFRNTWKPTASLSPAPTGNLPSWPPTRYFSAVTDL